MREIEQNTRLYRRQNQSEVRQYADSFFPSLQNRDVMQPDRMCVQFVPRTNQSDYVIIYQGIGCHSDVGRVGGRQQLSVGSECERKGLIMHELLHALGFWHEQSRFDRDSYITVHADNIERSRWHNFNIRGTVNGTTFGTPYDLGSILHYSAYSFAKDGSRPSVTPKVETAQGLILGQRLTMSAKDVLEVQKLYRCPVDTTHTTKLDYVVECTFDADLCNLRQDGEDNFNWTRLSGPTPTNNTGPNADHSTGAGSYMYAPATGRHNQKAKLLTPEVPAGDYCIDYYLYQDGDQVGKSEVLASGPRLWEQTLQSFIGNRPNEWMHVRLNVKSPVAFHIILKATVGWGDSGDIAIDDFLFYHGPCE